MLRGIAMTVAVLSMGCGPSDRYRIQTTHFRATYDREWKILRERDGRAVAIRFKRVDDDLEVRVFGWLARHDVPTPNAEAMGRLWDEPTVELREHRPSSVLRVSCGVEPTVKLFGAERPVTTLASDTWSTFLVSAQAEGSLVAVVARRPLARVATCDDLRVLTQEVQALVAGVETSAGLPTPPHQTTFDRLQLPPVIMSTPAPGEQRAD